MARVVRERCLTTRRSSLTLETKATTLQITGADRKMCSRYSFTSPPEAVRALFNYPQHPNFPPRNNVAPTQPVPIVRRGYDDEREFHLVRWGFVPSWAKDPATFTMSIDKPAADLPKN